MLLRDKLLGMGAAAGLALAAVLLALDARSEEPPAGLELRPAPAIAELAPHESAATSSARRREPTAVPVVDARGLAELRELFERAPASEAARRALARLAFVPDPRLSDDLRRKASSSLVASLRAPRRAEAERLVRLEAHPDELDAALQALARDANFDR